MKNPDPVRSGTISPAVSITTLGPEDAEDLAHLHGEIFPKPWSADDFRQLLQESATLGLAVTIPGVRSPAGFSIIRQLADEAEILTLGVLPAYRRGGLGRALVTAISAQASACDCIRIFLEVAEDNLPARFLYERLGYNQVGRRRQYYRRNRGPAIDALILSCDPGRTGADSI